VFEAENKHPTIAPPAAPAEPGERFFSLADLARSIRKRLWLLALIAFLCVGAAVGASFLTPPVYEASATAVVSPTGKQDNLANGIEGLQVLAGEMAVVGLNRQMTEEVASAQEDLSASALKENLVIAQIEGTRYLSFSYTDPDPDTARAVANDAARVFAREAPEASGMASEAQAKVSAFAVTPAALEGPDPLRVGLLALAVGLMLGIGLAFLLERLEASWSSPEEVEQFSGVPTFGTIPTLGRKRGAA
jgi:capsular polysaccharide biosynthesis protein